MISIGREIANIDNLFISPNGALCIVETKLWRNPEAHRTVVAQVLDYAQTLSSWDYSKLDKEVKNYMNKRFGQERSIYEIVKNEINIDIDEVEFHQRVQDTLTNGRFALLIVGDKIYPAATQLADIIQSAPHLQFTLGFVELRCFRFGDSSWPLIVIPNFIEKTKEVTRAVVKILYEEKKPEVQVDALEEEKTNIGNTSKTEFLASLPTPMKDIFQAYIERWIVSGYVIYWGKVGFSLRFQWKEKLTTVFEAYPEYASIFQFKRVEQHELPVSNFEQYKARMIESEVFGSEFAQGKRYVRYDRMKEGDIDLLLEETDKLVNSWNTSETNVP
ncbi:MAG: hypothetical protein ACE5GU_13110 [Candidatus Scalinduaceae bacterium]